MLPVPNIQTLAVDVPTPVAPVVANDVATAKRNTEVLVDVLANDSGYDAATIEITAAPPALEATAGVVGGKIRVTPATNFVGTTVVKYRVMSPAPNPVWSAEAMLSVTFTAPAAPVVVTQSAFVPYDTAVDIYVLTGATDADNDIAKTTTSLVITQPTHGTAVKAGSGSTLRVTYTPNSGYSGPDAFTFSIADSEGNISNVATVSLQVSPNIVVPETAPPFWVTDTSPFDQYMIRLGVRNIGSSTVDWTKDWAVTGTDVRFYVLPPEPGDPPLPLGAKGGWGTDKTNNYPYGSTRQVTVGQTFDRIRHLIRDGIHTTEFDKGGLTVVFPPGNFAEVDHSKAEDYWGCRAKVRMVGYEPPNVPHPFHRDGTNTTRILMDAPGSSGMQLWPTSGSRVRWENMEFTPRRDKLALPSDTHLFVVMNDTAINWQFVRCSFRQYAELFHGNSFKESSDLGTDGFKADKRRAYEHGTEDITFSWFGCRQTAVWMHDCVIFCCGGDTGRDWHGFYTLDGQVWLDKCAILDTPYMHSTSRDNRGHHIFKNYGPLVATNCFFANRLGNDTFWDDFDRGGGTTETGTWGQNIDLAHDAPFALFVRTQFFYRELQKLDGTPKTTGDVSTRWPFIQAGLRPQDGFGQTAPFPWALPDRYFQYLNRGNYAWGVWQDSLNPTRDPGALEPGGDKAYGRGIGYFKSDVGPGVASFSPSTPFWHIGYARDQPTLSTAVGAYQLSYMVKLANGDYQKRIETVTWDGTKFLLPPGGGPKAGELIPIGAPCSIWPTSRANNPRRRMLNPKYYDKSSPDYLWPRIQTAEFDPTAPNNKDWMTVRSAKVFWDCAAHYVGTNASTSSDPADSGPPVFMKVMPILPRGVASDDLMTLVGPLPPVHDGVGSKPSGAGDYTGDPADMQINGYFGGTMPTGGAGLGGSDFVDPQTVLFLNMPYSTENSRIGNSTTPAKKGANLRSVVWTGDDDFKPKISVGNESPLLAPVMPRMSIRRFNSVGAIVDYSAADAWPYESQTEIVGDVPLNATEITVADASGMQIGWTVGVFLTNDPWNLTPREQRKSDLKGIVPKVAAWRQFVKITDIVGNVITLEDPLVAPSPFFQSPTIAWDGTRVIAYKAFDKPNGLPTSMVDWPFAKLTWSRTDFD